MSNGLQVKDRVLSQSGDRGTVVLLLPYNKLKVLWDTDWLTGRTRVHRQSELTVVHS